jgi:hypothetical protein
MSKTTINWDDDVHMFELTIPLTDEQTHALIETFKRMQKLATPGRVSLVGDSGFAEKVNNYAAIFKKRLGVTDASVDVIKTSSLCMIDYGESNSGKRGVLFNRYGVFSITKDYPAVVQGDDVGGMVPWKIFYKFAKPVDGKSYWRVSFSDIDESLFVDEDVKKVCTCTVPNFEFKMFFNKDVTSLTPERMDGFFEEICDSLNPELALGEEDEDED